MNANKFFLLGRVKELIVYHLMFDEDDSKGCSMCSVWLDGFNGIIKHVLPRANFVVVANASPAKLHEFSKSKTWQVQR